MSRTETLCKRLAVLEARRVPGGCDWRLRLAKCGALLRCQSWTCPLSMTTKREARKAAKMARYKKYFDDLEHP